MPSDILRTLSIFTADVIAVLAGSLDKTAKIWSTASGECLQTLSGHTGSVLSAVFAADGATVALTRIRHFYIISEKLVVEIFFVVFSSNMKDVTLFLPLCLIYVNYVPKKPK